MLLEQKNYQKYTIIQLGESVQVIYLDCTSIWMGDLAIPSNKEDFINNINHFLNISLNEASKVDDTVTALVISRLIIFLNKRFKSILQLDGIY